MNLAKSLFLALSLFTIALFAPQSASAINITYQATDLTDTSGGDLWQYAYSVSDYSFAQDYGFTIYFDYDFYGDIEEFPSSPNSDWDVLTWDPAPVFFADGAYDALALVDSASLLDPFTISFEWLGSAGTSPGSQVFEIYDPAFNLVSTGSTTALDAAPVPEPSTWILFASGLGLVGWRRLRSRNCN